MFIGHFGVALAAKKIDNKPSLGTLFFAAQFLDLLWPIFVLLSIENVKIDPGNTAFTPLDFVYYPFSHSLLGSLILSVIFGTIYFVIKKNMKSSMLLGALVFSHWILDLITHRPDLPLAFSNSTKMGFGLWNSVALTLIIEGSIFIVGSYLYINTTKAANKKGKIILWSLLVFLSIIYLLNVFGPPPPSVDSIGIAGLSLWLIVAWGYWADRNRNLTKSV